MPLLNIKPTKKLIATIALEESTAISLERYAAFVQVSADEVINNALEYVFQKDREFQKYLSSNDTVLVPSTLRVKKGVAVKTGQRRGRKLEQMHGKSEASTASVSAR